MFTLFRFEFEGEGDNDLSFKEGDVISLKERDGEWLKGELRGKNGLFPLSFVEIIEDLPVESAPCNGADTSKEQNQPSTPTVQNKVRFLFLGNILQCNKIQRRCVDIEFLPLGNEVSER